jgi:hypothetical protein
MFLRPFAASAAALLIPAPVATAVPVIPTTQFYAGPPPARFDRPIKIVVVYGRIDKCGKPNWPGHPNAHFAGCSRDGITYLPDPCAYPEESFALTACHEAAHANGWPKDHGP